MNIPSAKYLKNKARNRLTSGKDPKQVILYYAAIAVGASFLTTAIQYGLDTQIANTGGLQNIGIRSVLSTIGNVLPILQAVLMMCLDLGYRAAMLRIGRRQYASAKTLKAGAERFWPLIGTRLLQGLMYIGTSIGASIIATQIFLMTPFSDGFRLLTMPLAAAGTLTPEALLSDELLIGQIYSSMAPLMIIDILLIIPVWLMLSCMYRLTDYVLIDNPQASAMFALRQSRTLMQGNLLRMLKIDLSFWWYYLIQALEMLLLYVDVILGIFGILLPVPSGVAFFGTLVLYLAADFARNYFLRNRVEITYTLAYSSLVPKEQTDGVVLGNIFTM